MIGKEGYSISETLFGYNDYRGIIDMLIEHVHKIDVNIKKDVLNSIILTGGASNTKMFFERLQNELWNTELSDIFSNFKTKFYFCNTH